jgi:hypothetical protein
MIVEKFAGSKTNCIGEIIKKQKHVKYLESKN